jgi:hypothetical protein
MKPGCLTPSSLLILKTPKVTKAPVDPAVIKALACSVL